MSCAGCAAKVTDALAQVPGVIRASVSYDDATAKVTYDPARVSPDALVPAVNAIDGYNAEVVP